MPENNLEQNEIDLIDLLKVLQKNIKLILSFFILGALLTFGWTYFFMEKTYQSYSTVYIQPNIQDGNINLNELNVNQRLVGTYTELAKSNAVLSQVQKYFDNENLTVNQLRNAINISGIGDTQIIKFTTTTKDANLSARITNRVVIVFLNEVSNTMTIDNLRVIDIAMANPVAVGPNLRLNTAIGAVIGIMIGIGIAFLRKFLDRTIHNRKDAELTLNIPVLGETFFSDEPSY